LRRDGTLVQSVGATPAPYDQAETTAHVATWLARLNGEWTHRLGPRARVEWRGGFAEVRVPAHSFRTEFTNGSESRTLEETSDAATRRSPRAASWWRRSSSSTAW
jgi:hypothetical protein